MNSRERFLVVVASKVLDRRLIWVMRQTGRDLPEFCELKAHTAS